MAGFKKYRYASAFFRKHACGVGKIVLAGDRLSEQEFGFRYVWSDDSHMWNKILAESCHRIGLEQRIAGCSYHHGIEDYVGYIVGLECGADGMYQFR